MDRPAPQVNLPVPPAGRAPTCPVRVLLVDDNDTILGLAASTLASRYVVVGMVRDGRAALDAADVLQPDVIVIDISMPEMNGIEVATRLRARGSTAAVVFLSAYDEEALIQATRDVGGRGYVVKQYLASDLAVAVGEAHAGREFTSCLR
jgi:DNA-binding NarL/FixJ family response regulator